MRRAGAAAVGGRGAAETLVFSMPRWLVGPLGSGHPALARGLLYVKLSEVMKKVEGNLDERKIKRKEHFDDG